MKLIYQDNFLKKHIEYLKSDDVVKSIENIYKLLNKKIKTNKRIFFAGNGGSASIANHAVIDFIKNYKIKGKNMAKSFFSLSSNNEVITAIANDLGYENIFSYQLSKYSKNNDLLILISSSGNSPNIIKAAKFANKNNLELFSLVGFDGGKLKKISKNYVHINIRDYGVVEDLHQIILHAVINQSYQN